MNQQPAGNLVSTGTWGEIFTWELYTSDTMPPVELCTAVACVALADDHHEQIVLTRNERGWEVLAGHIEPGETIDQAVRREAIEEGGYIISEMKYFGFRKITATAPPQAGSRAAAYPYPISYVVYFVAQTDQPIGQPTGEEIAESRTCSIEQLRALAHEGLINDVEQEIIRLGLQAAASQ